MSSASRPPGPPSGTLAASPQASLKAGPQASLQASPQASPWWHRHVHVDRRPRLLARSKLIIAIRNWLAGQEFIEVEGAVLQVSPGNEAHIGAFATQMQDGEGERRLYLHASPEFACKKLLSAGESQIFSLSHVFRNGERGPLHHPEFTMLEWYRVGQGLSALQADCMALLALTAEACATTTLQFHERSADPFLAPEVLSVAEAFSRYAGIDLTLSLTPEGTDRGCLARQAAEINVRVSADDSWSDLFSKILSERVEPQLGLGRVTFLCDYPASEAALAQRSPQDPRWAERFELYACGVELANAFHELTDAREQRHRFELEMEERARIYGERYPLDEDFLAALAHMPPASGIALGFDRLMMLATGASKIEDVIWTPVVRTVF